jgi:hypothetical protein
MAPSWLVKSDDGWRRISKQKFSSVQEVIYLCKAAENILL